MQKNVGGTDQLVRGVAGAALLGGAAFAPVDRKWRIAMGVGGAAALGTAATGYCMANAALGVNTATGSQPRESLDGLDASQTSAADVLPDQGNGPMRIDGSSMEGLARLGDAEQGASAAGIAM